MQVVKAYGESKASNYAMGMALAGFLAMFPLILGILAIIGIAVSDPGLQSKAYDSVASVFPSDAHTEISSALEGVKRSAGILGIVSILGLLWSGTSLFAAMEFALTQIFGSKQRDLLRQRLMGLLMVVVFLTAVLVAVAANSAAAVPSGTGASLIVGVIGAVVGAIVLIALLVAIYRFVPNRTFAVRDVVPGAVVAGIAIEVFSLLFPLYSKVAHGFNTYGQQFALFFLLATWMTFLSQFILLGAVFNKVRLGPPQAEGIAATPDGEGREQKRPVDAVQEQKPGAAGAVTGRETGGDRAGRPAPRDARAALGLATAAAAAVAIASRVRRRRQP